MATLKLEVWIEADGLPGCCFAGPAGDGLRKLMAENGPAKLVWTFKAGSRFEAMTKYNQYLGRDSYTTDEALDYEPYPEEWLREQMGG